MDEVLKEFLELDVPESMCNETKRFVYTWLKAKFTSHNSDYTKCTNEVFKYVTDNICDEGITKKAIKTILKKHFA